MNADAFAYVALSLLAGILVLAFIAACAAIALAVKFLPETADDRKQAWRETVFGDAEKGR